MSPESRETKKKPRKGRLGKKHSFHELPSGESAEFFASGTFQIAIPTRKNEEIQATKTCLGRELSLPRGGKNEVIGGEHLNPPPQWARGRKDLCNYRLRRLPRLVGKGHQRGKDIWGRK